MKVYISKALALCLIVTCVVLCATNTRGSSPYDVPALNRTIEEAHEEGQRWVRTPIGVANAIFGLKAVAWPQGETGKSEKVRLPIYSIVFQKPNSNLESSQDWFHATVQKKENGTWEFLEVIPCMATQITIAKDKLEQRRAILGPPGFDFLTQGPLEILEFLKLKPYGTTSMISLPFGWVREYDLPALIALLDSTEPCSSVTFTLSSYMDYTGSTIGHEAAFLVEGFRIGIYPPRIHSKFGTMDIEEIKNWWKGRPGT